MQAEDSSPVQPSALHFHLDALSRSSMRWHLLLVTDGRQLFSVLSVGATQYNGTESGAFLSTGGFSNIFPRPWYQDKAVSTFLDTLGDEYAGLYNASGRGIPDVAAIGAQVEATCQEVFGLVAGTSISAPVFASTIAILNDRLLAAGKPTLGFLQPLLYENPNALTDIITGNNPGCNTVRRSSRHLS